MYILSRVSPLSYFPLFQNVAFVARRKQLRSLVCDSKYSIQKDRLRQDFEAFLSTRAFCPPPLCTASSLETASPIDIVRFLHDRDSRGRTTVHAMNCPHFGNSGLFSCDCPRHLAAGTIDSYIGQLRAVFNDLGRLGKYVPGDLRSNPCDSSEVRTWLKASEKEQRLHRVPVVQARPIFSPHLRMLAMKIKALEASLPVSSPFLPDRYLLKRDSCFFKVQWFCGDRAGDLGNALGKEVVRLEDGSLLFNHTIGKQIRQSDGQLLVVPPVPECPELCPVAAFDDFVAACRSNGINLAASYLFAPTKSPCHLSLRPAPFSSAAATKRLKFYLPEDDLTAHGARAGCAITLAMLGASLETIMEHCRWATTRVARHYTKVEKIRRLDESARVLQRGVASGGDVPPDADSAAFLYEMLNSGLSQSPAI